MTNLEIIIYALLWFSFGLVAQFGQAYVEYKQKVPAIIPFRGRAAG